jgi:GT2 family glycosyltransferase
MSLCNEAWFKLVGGMGGSRGWLFGPRLRRQYATDRDSDSLTAACLLVRREAYEAVAGLDERFFLYAEDVDLCRRLRQAGWRLRYVAGATVRHMGGGSGSVDPPPAALAYRASQVAFYAKHRGPLSRLMLRAYLEAKYGLGALRGHSGDRAIWDWLRRGLDPPAGAGR